MWDLETFSAAVFMKSFVDEKLADWKEPLTAPYWDSDMLYVSSARPKNPETV